MGIINCNLLSVKVFFISLIHLFLFISYFAYILNKLPSDTVSYFEMPVSTTHSCIGGITITIRYNIIYNIYNNYKIYITKKI